MSGIEFLRYDPMPAGSPPYSPAVRAGDYVYVSGQVPVDLNGNAAVHDIEVQTRQVMHNIKRALALSGCTLSDIVKTTVWLADARDFARFNRVYAGFFDGQFPARTTTEAKLMGSFLLEIEAVAYRPL